MTMSKAHSSRRSSRARSAPPPPADAVELRWGRDILTIRDRAWCQAIEAEGCQTALDDAGDLWGRYSRHDAELARAGFGPPLAEIEQLPRGVARLAQPPIARQCLKVFLGFDLPMAMECGDSYGQPMRFVAVRAQFDVLHRVGSTLLAEFVLDGLQLHANGSIRRPIRSIHTTFFSKILRRSLDNKWHEIGFHTGTPSGELAEYESRGARTLYVEDGAVPDEDGTDQTGPSK